MTQDIDSWLIAVTALCEETEPNMDWSEPLADNEENFEQFIFSSFQSFVDYPISFLPIDLIVEAKLLVNNPYFLERSKTILNDLNNISFSNVSELSLLSYALSTDPTLLSNIRLSDSNYLQAIWCLTQCIESDIQKVIQFINFQLFDNIPISNQVQCQAFILLLELVIRKIEDAGFSQPPFSSDEFEVIFCLAYCSERSEVKSISASIVPKMANLISQTGAAHLLFRRMLPYCSMENRQGQKMAMTIIESIVSNYERFLTCISTWISLHPFCVAASNNLLIDMQRHGLITNQMKMLIKNIISMNKLLLKNKIKMTNEVKMALPRSLWRVDFPPPIQYVKICNETCKKILSSIESKRSLLIPLIVLFFILYILYVLL